MLCATCSSIFITADISSLNYENKTPLIGHHLDISTLRQAAEDKCYVCSRLLKIYLAGNAPYEQEFRLRCRLERYRHPALWFLEFLLPSSVHSKAVLFFLTQIKSSAEVHLPWYLSEDSFPNNTSHPHVFLWAKNHLNRCGRHHNCGLRMRRNWLPPRVLDIRNDAVKLVDTDDNAMMMRYATLSHCWGPNPSFFVLTSDNVNELRVAVPYAQLPKTFQEAIVVVRSLGLPYLWIDSLCILQSGKGSQEDWQRHGRLMSSIYANCTFNIAADSGATSEDGLFVSRDVDLIRHPIINWIPGITHQLYAFDTYDACEKSTLSTRSWVFQERLLSPRVIHFTRDQVFWECRKETTAFEFLLPMVEALDDFSDKDIGFNLPDSNSLTYNSLSGKTANEHWMWLVELYSERNLSKPDQDKLIALGGIAEHMAALSKDEYVAGLFRKGLPKDLLWQVGERYSGRTARRPVGSYRAPTWSWASVDGPVRFPSYYTRELRTLATVLETTTVLADPDNPYGQVTDANLVLRAPLLKCSWQSDENRKPIPVVALPDGLHITLDQNHATTHQEVYFDTEDPVLSDDIQYALLFIISGESEGLENVYGPSIQLNGLVLAREDADGDAWKRTGRFNITSFSFDEVLFRTVLDGEVSYADVRII